MKYSYILNDFIEPLAVAFSTSMYGQEVIVFIEDHFSHLAVSVKSVRVNNIRYTTNAS